MKDEREGIDTILQQLVLGQPGLAIMFWVYGILGGLVWLLVGASIGVNEIINPDQSFLYGHKVVDIGLDNPFLFLTGFGVLYNWGFIAYYWVVFRGVWRASDSYMGNPAWRVLAKFWVIINSVVFIIPFLKSCSYF